MSEELKPDSNMANCCHFAAFGKDGFKVFLVSCDLCNNTEGFRQIWEKPNVRGYSWNHDGSQFAIYTKETISVYNFQKEISLKATYQIGPCEKLYFSPKSTYIVAILPFTKAVHEPNVKLICLSIGEIIPFYSLSEIENKQRYPLWSDQETYLFRLKNSSIEVYKGQLHGNSLKPAHTISLTLKGGAISVTKQKEDGSVCIGVFTVPTPNKLGTIEIYRFDDLSSPPKNVTTQYITNAEEATLSWNVEDTVLLVQTQTSVDKSGKSYFGTSELYYLQNVDNSSATKICSAEQGAVHDFKWSPTRNEFIVLHGSMPPNATLYNGKTGESRLSLGQPQRNTIQYNGFGRFFYLGGFGNLIGDVDIWDRNKQRIIGTTRIRCSVTCDWSPCGRYLLSATTFPRMRVDNCIKILLYNGEILKTLDFEELYNVSWRPVALNKFVDRAPSKERIRNSTAPAEVKNIYVPKNLSRDIVHPMMESTNCVQKKAMFIENANRTLATGKSKTARRNAARREKVRNAKNTDNA